LYLLTDPYIVLTLTQVREALKISEEKRLAKEKMAIRITEPDYGNYVTLGFEIQLKQ
jgi:hypothetical protein